MSRRLRPVDLVDLVDPVDPVDLGERDKAGGASAKLELRLVDLQCPDSMVKRGCGNSELRRRSRRTADSAPALGERRNDGLALTTGEPLNRGRRRSPWWCLYRAFRQPRL